MELGGEENRFVCSLLDKDQHVTVTLVTEQLVIAIHCYEQVVSHIFQPVNEVEEHYSTVP